MGSLFKQFVRIDGVSYQLKVVEFEAICERVLETASELRFCTACFSLPYNPTQESQNLQVT